MADLVDYPRVAAVVMAPILPGIALDTGSYRLRVGRERTFLMPVGILEFVAHNPGNHGDVGWQDSSEDTHPRSLGALGINWSSPLRCAYPVAGRTGLTTTATLSGTRRSRIWCETDMDAYAGAINSVWQSAGMAVDECETADYSGLTKGEAVAAVGGYSGGLALLVLSFAVSYAGFLSSNTTSGAAVIILLIGAGVAFVSSFFVWATARGRNARFVWGAVSAGGGALSLAVWPFVLPPVVSPGRG